DTEARRQSDNVGLLVLRLFLRYRTWVNFWKHLAPPLEFLAHDPFDKPNVGGSSVADVSRSLALRHSGSFQPRARYGNEDVAIRQAGTHVRLQSLRSQPVQFAVQPPMLPPKSPFSHEQGPNPGKSLYFVRGQAFRCQFPPRITRKNSFQHSLTMELSG